MKFTKDGINGRNTPPVVKQEKPPLLILLEDFYQPHMQLFEGDFWMKVARCNDVIIVISERDLGE